MTGKSRRFGVFLLAGASLSLALYLVLSALNSNIILFYSPSQITDTQKQGQRLRLGGLVEKDSVSISGLNSQFGLSDGGALITVSYNGALPDLFREGQGIVAQGRFENDIFEADSVLAKHDEAYMPREIADSLKEQGLWQGDTN